MENRNNMPVVPLPNPGEGGPVFPGNNGSANTPVVPLPNPGEGGPVFPGNGGNRPGNPGNQPGFPGNPGTPGNPPAFPGNRPGAPGNPPPGNSSPSFPGGGIQLLPGSTYPPVQSPYAAVRFLNATSGYAPFRVSIDGTLVVRLLDAGYATGYLRVPSGLRRITISGLDGYIYLEQSLRFPAASASTVAIVNRTGGLALRLITDSCVNC